MKRFIDFVSVALFITNVWIYLYVGLLDFLNFTYPAKVKPLSLNINPFPNPEPFDIPIYLFLTVGFVAILLLNETFIKGSLQKISPVLKGIFLIFLLALFITKMGPFPLAYDPFPYKLRSDASLYWVFFIGYLVSVVFILVQTVFLTKTLKKKIFLPLIYLILSLLIAAVAFDGQFYVQAHDARYFYGPVWEIVHGKTIFTDIPSQYGFLSVLFFSLIQNLFQIDFVYLPLTIWIMFIIEYVLIFHLIFKISNSLMLGLLGFFALLTTNYLGVYHLPQGMSLRWLPLILAIYLFYRTKRFAALPLLFILPILSLWSIDTGLALMLGFLSTVVIVYLTGQITGKKLIAIGLYLIIVTSLIMLVLNLIHTFLGMHTINFLKIYETLKKNSASGLLMMPMEYQTYFWFFVLIYFSAFIYFLRKPNKNNSQLILLSANIMFFASIYYVGRSMPHNLFQLSPLLILTLFLLIAAEFPNLTSTKLRSIISILIFIFLIVIPAYYKKEYFASDFLFKKELLKDGFSKSWISYGIDKKFAEEANLIEKHIKEKEAIILSVDESYLFYMIDKKNLLNANPQAAIAEMEEIDLAIQEAVKICPDKIAIDCKIHQKCLEYKSFTDGWYFVIPSIFEAIEKKCNVKYEPLECTNQLCIAEKRKL